MTSRRPAGLRRKAQKGAVAVAFIILAIALIGFVGLAMDIGRLYVSKAELQNAADACALAAAGALTGVNANQLTVAEDYGIAAGTRNLVGMQAVPATITPNADVTFSSVLNGTYLTTLAAASNALSIRYVRCTLTENNIPTVLLKVVNLIPGQTVGLSSVQATAVASLEPSISNCALPLAVCKKSGSSGPNWGYTPGEWLEGRFDPQSNIYGKFKWVDFPGLNQTRDLKCLLEGAGQCDISGTNTVTPTQGNLNSLVPYWNWRFGIINGGPAVPPQTSCPPTSTNPNPEPHPPDKTGYAYDTSNWNPASNVFDKSRSNNYPDMSDTNAAWNNVPALGGQWRWIRLNEYPARASRRLVVGPVVDCSAWGPGTSAQPILGWACYLMLNPIKNPNSDPMYIEYRGPAEDLSSGCVTSGAPGGPSAGGPKVPTLVQ